MAQTTSATYDFGLNNRNVSDDGDKLTISGVASNWNEDLQGDSIARYAFEAGLQRYLTTNPILLYSHRFSVPVGKVTKALVDDDGLHVTAEIPKPDPGTEAMNVYKLVAAGVIKAFSVGGLFTRAVVAGRKVITAVDLQEISIAPVGVNPTTTFGLSAQVGKAFGDVQAADPYAIDRLWTTAKTIEVARLTREVIELRKAL